MSTTTTTKGIVLSQEITRLKVEAELLIEKIESYCGFIEVYFVANDNLEPRYIDLNEKIQDLLKFLLEKQISLVSGPSGRIKTIDAFFENTTYESSTDYYKCAVFEGYLKYYFPFSIPEELRPNLLRLHRDINTALRRLYSRVAVGEVFDDFYSPPRRKKQRVTSRSRSNINF